MPPLLTELLRLRHDPTARFAAVMVAAVVYGLAVLSWRLGPGPTAVAAVLAVAILCWRRPVLALTLGSVALLAVTVLALARPDAVRSVGPYAAVLVPVAVGALDARPVVRRAAVALAVATAVAAVAWGYGVGTATGASPALGASAGLVCAAPLALAAVLRRPALRDRIVAAVRERMPSELDRPLRLRMHVGAAVALYVLCVALDLLPGNVATVLTALPLCAALVWAGTRPDVSLALAAVGLALIAVVVPLESRLGTGETLAACAAVLPVLGALLSEEPRHRSAGLVLVGGAAAVFSAVAGTILPGVVALLLGGAAVLAAWVRRQRRTTSGLRSRLRESERRGRVAERGVQVEQERNRIAREVHDVVAHSLAVVIAQADGARFAALDRPAAVAPALEAIADTARTALGEVRTMLHDLRSMDPGAPVPGPADVATVVATVRALGVEVRESAFGAPRRMTEDAGLALFRIAQEALTNAIRHGDRDAPITIETDWGEQAVVLVVTNAVRQDPEPATERPGHGIPGMRERAGLVGGEATAGTGSNGSFRVRASLPVLPSPEEERAGDDEVTDAIGRLLALGARAA